MNQRWDGPHQSLAVALQRMRSSTASETLAMDRSGEHTSLDTAVTVASQVAEAEISQPEHRRAPGVSSSASFWARALGARFGSWRRPFGIAASATRVSPNRLLPAAPNRIERIMHGAAVHFDCVFTHEMLACSISEGRTSALT